MQNTIYYSVDYTTNAILSRQRLYPWMSHTTDSMTFEIFVGISFSSLLLFPGHGDIQKVSYTARRQTDVWGIWLYRKRGLLQAQQRGSGRNQDCKGILVIFWA